MFLTLTIKKKCDKDIKFYNIYTLVKFASQALSRKVICNNITSIRRPDLHLARLFQI